MSLYDAAIFGFAALFIAAMYFVPRKVSAQRRLRIGLVLFVAGWASILLALRFDELPVLQSETVAFVVAGSATLAIVVALLFLTTAFFDWLGLTRPRHQRRRFPPFT